ncbi:serine/threonine-protein kinase [Streptomyces sp. NBC_00091]|uniref:serine/threonine-protein kinase n=1 Tax=Streptomyces sp. NBC_00091 TaxID=2975648 RepID=UPI002252D17D|nr:serine/threonine-protein kinase [Streptomyces sp. NBC_00091]MCX5379213.1 serine/threonine protein kinase [Streptomyces sp. NBC_00091]
MSGNESGDTGRVIAGRYRLLGELGRGGMGLVWRARDEVLGREVAVKEVRAPAGLDAAEVERMYRRLEREAWAAARVSHRGVVTVYDVASEEGRPWIVMELVRGLSLAEVLEGEGPMTPQRAAHIGEQVLAALRSAHEAGVLHRDVKPANVLIANDGRVVLSDFGIARLEGSSALTMTGEVVGSPEFLAPERALGQEPGPESDLWSLGVMLYAAVEGVSPFRKDTPLSTLQAVVDSELPPPRRAGTLEPVLEGLLRKDPGARLPAAEAARMLRIIGAGGAVRDPGGPASGPGAPTATTRAVYGETPPVPHAPVPVPAPVSGPTSGQGRAGAVLTLGIVVLLLAVALLGWLLLRDTGGEEEPGGGPSAPASGAQTSASPSAPPSASASASASPSTSAEPPQGVTVYVHTLRAAYTGSCPPPEVAAPAFTGTIEVARTPAVVEYRWVGRDGGTAATAGWQSITYEAGGARTRQLNHTEPGDPAGASVDGAVRLEVRRPAQTASAWLEYSLTCEKETPTGGASSPGSPGPSGSPAGTGTPTPSAGVTP